VNGVIVRLPNQSMFNPQNALNFSTGAQRRWIVAPVGGRFTRACGAVPGRGARRRQ